MSELAKLVGEDTYHHIVDPDHFRKGDRFRMERTVGEKKYVRYGEAAMNGHAVSKDFGWLHQPTETLEQCKRAAYEGTDRNYINVRFDDGGEYHSLRPNESVYPHRDKVVFYSTAEVAARKAKDLAEYEERKRKSERERNLREAEEAVAAAERLLFAARNRLQIERDKGGY